MGKVILFDFDGTLADSFGMAMSIFHELTGNKHTLEPETLEALRGLPAGKVMKELGIAIWRAPFMLSKGRSMMGQRLDELSLFPDVTKTIQALHKRGYRMFILSSNSAENIMQFTEHQGISAYFEGIYGGIGLFSKARVMRKVMRTHHFSIDDSVYIGDEARDVRAAHRVGVPCIAVSWGYNSLAALEATNPTHIAKRPKDLLHFLP
jgi:phosphoglycolate phosphatase-like HAD superfamily hydrolase